MAFGHAKRGTPVAVATGRTTLPEPTGADFQPLARVPVRRAYYLLEVEAAGAQVLSSARGSGFSDLGEIARLS